MVDVSRGWYEEMLEDWTIGVDCDGRAFGGMSDCWDCLGSLRGLGQLTRRGWPSWSVCESVLVRRKDEADWFCAARRTRAGCECGRLGEAGRGGV